MNRKCVFILPYFGKFKNYFNLFLKSCEANSDYQWLIISDQRSPRKIANVNWINISFEKFRKKVQSKFDFKISLEKPYKLCDYKPAYGYIFEEEIKQYEYWGHCDCDLIFGNMNTILTPLLEKNYDKLFAAGHLTIYKNEYENNRMFFKCSKSGLKLYKIVFTDEKIFGFDEDYFCENIHTIFKFYNKRIYDEDLSFNVLPTFYNLVRGYYIGGEKKWNFEKKHLQLLLWNGNEVFTLCKTNGKIQNKIYLYTHLLMRKYTNSINIPEGNFLINITPKEFQLLEETDDYALIWNTQKKFYFSMEIIAKFVRERYYDLKRRGKMDADFDPYKEYR